MKYNLLRPHLKAAFSILEVMMACGVLAITAAAAIGTLIRMNHNASLSRLHSAASTVAQERIDRMLEDGPYKAGSLEAEVPEVLRKGTAAIGTEAAPTIPIYTDPDTNQVVVLGWMTSTVTEVPLTYGPYSLKVRVGDVTVGYQYRGKSYSVRMNTVRSPDA
jgi:type II secretory pathway pseudopilin PulG